MRTTPLIAAALLAACGIPTPDNAEITRELRLGAMHDQTAVPIGVAVDPERRGPDIR